MATPSFSGAFTPRERAYLEQTFGACRLTLLARGTRTPTLVLLRWEPETATTAQASPLRRPLSRGFYLLQQERGQLEPVLDGPTLTQRYPEEFDPALLGTVRPTRWQQLSKGWTNPRPWHIVAILLLWLLIIAFLLWRGS